MNMIIKSLPENIMQFSKQFDVRKKRTEFH